MIATLNEIKAYLNKTITTVTSGLLTVGTRYRITVIGTADFTNVGAAYNELNCTFIATGTTPTSWGSATLQIISDEDLVIESLIPQVTGHVHSICSTDFENTDYQIEDLELAFAVGNINDTITAASRLDELYLGRFNDIKIEDSYYNNTYFTVDSHSDTVLTLNFLDEVYAETTDCTITRIDYPKGLKIPFIKMINFQLNNMTPVSGGNVKSETIGKYSVTYDKISSLYSPQIINELQSISGYISNKIYFLI